MAIARSQTTGKFRVSNGTTITGTFGTAPSVGDLVVVGFWGYNNVYYGPGNCTDNQGNVYSLVARSVGNAVCAVWWTVVKATNTSFQVTITASPSATMWGAGCATSWTSTVGWGLFDVRAINNGNSTTPSTGTTATLAVADEVVVALVAAISANQASITVESVSPAWVEEAEELSWTTYIPGEMVSRVVSATTAQSSSWTLATSNLWMSTIATFRELPGGGGGGGSYAFFG